MSLEEDKYRSVPSSQDGTAQEKNQIFGTYCQKSQISGFPLILQTNDRPGSGDLLGNWD